MTRYKPREWHQRQERRALAAPRSCTKCARSVCHGHCLRHCSRAARRRRSISRAHPMRAHIVRSRGQVAVHGRTPAVAARMPPAVLLVINLRIGCCLIQSSQRCSEACRIRAVWYLLRLSAFRPGDRSWMVRWSSPSSIEPSMAGRRSVRWRAERCTARPRKHAIKNDCRGSGATPERRARDRTRLKIHPERWGMRPGSVHVRQSCVYVTGGVVVSVSTSSE